MLLVVVPHMYTCQLLYVKDLLSYTKQFFNVLTKKHKDNTIFQFYKN